MRNVTNGPPELTSFRQMPEEIPMQRVSVHRPATEREPAQGIRPKEASRQLEGGLSSVITEQPMPSTSGDTLPHPSSSVAGVVVRGFPVSQNEISIPRPKIAVSRPAGDVSVELGEAFTERLASELTPPLSGTQEEWQAFGERARTACFKAITGHIIQACSDKLRNNTLQIFQLAWTPRIENNVPGLNMWAKFGLHVQVLPHVDGDGKQLIDYAIYCPHDEAGAGVSVFGLAKCSGMLIDQAGFGGSLVVSDKDPRHWGHEDFHFRQEWLERREGSLSYWGDTSSGTGSSGTTAAPDASSSGASRPEASSASPEATPSAPGSVYSQARSTGVMGGTLGAENGSIAKWPVSTNDLRWAKAFGGWCGATLAGGAVGTGLGKLLNDAVTGPFLDTRQTLRFAGSQLGRCLTYIPPWVEKASGCQMLGNLASYKPDEVIYWSNSMTIGPVDFNIPFGPGAHSSETPGFFDPTFAATSYSRLNLHPGVGGAPPAGATDDRNGAAANGEQAGENTGSVHPQSDGPSIETGGLRQRRMAPATNERF